MAFSLLPPFSGTWPPLASSRPVLWPSGSLQLAGRSWKTPAVRRVLGSRDRALAARSPAEGPAAGRGGGRPHTALAAKDSTTPPPLSCCLPLPLPEVQAVLRWPGVLPTHCHQLLLPNSGFDFGLSRAPRGYLQRHSLGAGLTLLGALARGQDLRLSSVFSHTHTRCGSKRLSCTFPLWC